MSAVLPSPADALVAEIERKVAASRAALFADAEREAAESRARADEKARRQWRRLLEEMRAESLRGQTQAIAEIETARGRAAALASARALEQAWPALAAAIEARWAEPAARAAWIASLLAAARTRLGARPWTLRHPAALPAAEVDALRAALAGRDATLRADDALAAGLVVEAEGARLDGSPAALLAERADVESLLLAALAQGGAAASERGDARPPEPPRGTESHG